MPIMTEKHRQELEQLQTGLGQRVKRLRTFRGTSQLALALALGIAPAEIWRYESGRGAPSIARLAALAMQLDTTTDYLLGLSSSPSPTASGAGNTAEVSE